MALEGNGLPWYGEDWSGILLSICGTIFTVRTGLDWNARDGYGRAWRGLERYSFKYLWDHI
jgi:hypothetical protein